MSSKPKILIFAALYLPGFKGGGPIQSIANIVAALGSEFDFHIITYDRDLGDTSRYSGIEINKWTPVGKAHVWYLDNSSSLKERLTQIRRASAASVWSSVYLNSFFDPLFVLFPLILVDQAQIKTRQVIVAPRGQLGLEALRLGTLKKRAYLALFNLFGFKNRVRWQTTSATETEHFKAVFGPETFEKFDAVFASNLPAQASQFPLKPIVKSTGDARIIFLSRISPKKNLLGALEALRSVKCNQIVFTIAGPEEDGRYVQECRSVAQTLGSAIQVDLIGPVSRDQIPALLSSHHALLFPTFGENFGHAIAEAMMAGCVPIISDQTPWRGLKDSGVGWDVSLENPQELVDAVQSLVDLDANDYQALRARTTRFGKDYSAKAAGIEETRKLLTPN